MTNPSPFSAVEQLPLDNILTAEAFQNLPPDAASCIIVGGMTYSGRHTQALAMKEELEAELFVYTDWIQKYHPADTHEADVIKLCLSDGYYLPDEIAIKIADWAFGEFLSKAMHPDQFYTRPFIVVGYPQTEAQLKHFQRVLQARRIFALIAVLEVKPAEALRRMKIQGVKRVGHAIDGRPEVQKRKIGEYYLRSHGLLKWLLFTGKATLFKTCLDKSEYERRKTDIMKAEEFEDYVVISSTDVTNDIMKFLNMFHFISNSGA